MKQQNAQHLFTGGQQIVNIFSDHHNLIDSNLAEIMPQVAVILSHQGYPQAFQFLQHQAVSTNHEIIDRSQANLFDNILRFLINLLETTLNSQSSNCNPNSIHSLIKENPSLMTSEFIYLLKSWGIITLSTVSEEEAPIIGSLLINLGGFFMSCPHGDEALNIEIAIAALETALPVFSGSELRSQWAIVHNNLALAYSDRLFGNRLDNMRLAYQHYDLAKRVFLRQAFPQEWVYISNHLTENININSLASFTILPNSKAA
ncbi:MAG: hypothetical protein QNJ68_16700 [Microcoleaceae cyanobacterium MO_207.B10]|nr:hypothetical protein [Microcoleaceae cyanobacterium MO_207.B10]